MRDKIGKTFLKRRLVEIMFIICLPLGPTSKNYAWRNSVVAGFVMSKIGNNVNVTSIGCALNLLVRKYTKLKILLGK